MEFSPIPTSNDHVTSNHVSASLDDRSRQRLLGIDVARAVAIGGMACIHFLIIVTMFGRESALNEQLLKWLSGRPATMFMILAGIGISLRCNHRAAHELRNVRGSLRRRGAFFLVVGLLNVLWWDGDILRVYGIGYIVASFFIQSSGRVLFIMAASCVATFLALFAVLDFERNWDFATLSYQNIWTIQGATLNLFFNGFRAVFPWMGLLFFGMWIGRRDMRDLKLARTAILVGLVIWVLAETTSMLLISEMSKAYPKLDREIVIALVGTESVPALPLFLLSSCGFVVAVVFGLIQVCEKFCDRKIVGWLAASGRMAFTWYILHIGLVLGFAACCVAMGPVPAVYGMVVTVAFMVGMTLVSNWYLRRYRFGPLEWVLRRVADGKAASVQLQ